MYIYTLQNSERLSYSGANIFNVTQSYVMLYTAVLWTKYVNIILLPNKQIKMKVNIKLSTNKQIEMKVNIKLSPINK